MPIHRENGAPLLSDKIQSCVIFFFDEREITGSQRILLKNNFSMASFRSKGSEISRFITSGDIPKIIVTGSPNAIVSTSPGQASYTFHNLIADTYYFSVSCFDWDNSYSQLAKTASITTH